LAVGVRDRDSNLVAIG